MASRVSLLCQECQVLLQQVRSNSNRAGITRVKRFIYPRVYPTIMVLADGSSINFRHSEPRKIVKIPLELSELSEEQRSMVIAQRKPKKKVVIEEEIEDSFDVQQYSHLWKK